MKLSLKQLEAFVWVADLGSFRKAADRLNTTQPNISSRIATLETLLGQTTMERDAGSVRLTSKGTQLLIHARKVLRAVDDLAVHPETARHISGKIAASFVADQPDVDMVNAMTAAFIDTDGFLPSVYAVMLDHPAAWTPELQKIKSPQRFITSAMRALGVSGDVVEQASRRNTHAVIAGPLRVMGQPWQLPNGPDGWPDDSTAWITPQGMAGRISWAMRAPRIMLKDQMPDPRDFVQTALGSLANQDVIFAAGAAEVRDEGVGIVLASPAFQRS